MANYETATCCMMPLDNTSDPHQRELARAAELGKPLRRAANIARANGTGYAVFGVLTILLSLAGSITGLLLGGCLLAVGIAQRRTAPRLVAAAPDSPRILARNELLLLAAIIAYAVAQMTVVGANTSADLEMLGESAGIDVADLIDAMARVVYGSVIAVSLLYQGGMALYFLRRSPLVERNAREIPEWARETLAKL